MVINLAAEIATVDRVIDTWYEANYKPRTRLGLSEIGHKCDRVLWYKYHEYPALPPAGRVLRLFRLGEIIEDQIILDLKQAGYRHHSGQKEVIFTCDEKVQLTGHIDGIIEGLLESGQPHLFECKSASGKRFKELLKLGSYEQWHEQYKCQVHVYMLGLKLKRALVIVYNKDTSELYQERIKIDRAYAVNRLERAFRVIQMEQPPERACPKSNWWEARFCPFREICWN